MSLRLALGAALLAALAAPAAAHDGPPFPVLVDEDWAGHVVSVWADPDVGVGTFYVYVEPEPAAGVTLDVVVQPADARLEPARHAAVTADERQPYQLLAETEFDRRGDWVATFEFRAGDEVHRRELDVEVTPPGAGRIDLIWFLSPFLIVAFLWGKVLLVRREERNRAASAA